jgi:hypothetical protein
MFGLSVAFYATMSASPVTNRLEWFALAVATLVVALSEGLDAFVLVVADGWDRIYEVPELSIVDRSVSFAVVSALWPRPEPVSTDDQREIVRPLT